MTSTQYSTDLLSLLELDIPKSLPRPDGFLEVADRVYSETTNTRIYAYFLDQNRNRELAEVFFGASLTVIERNSHDPLVYTSSICM